MSVPLECAAYIQRRDPLTKSQHRVSRRSGLRIVEPVNGRPGAVPRRRSRIDEESTSRTRDRRGGPPPGRKAGYAFTPEEFECDVAT
jgi:hypothetical protein